MQESRTSAYSTLRVKPCSGALGAEVEGLDASRPMDEETVAEVQRAFADHLILFFRDQTLTLSTFEAFAAQIGPLTRSDYGIPAPDGATYAGRVVRPADAPRDERNFGDFWHMDQSIRACPNSAFALYSAEAPPYGGDTMFANMYLAYEALSPGLRAMCDQLIVMHSQSGVYGKDGLGGPGDMKPLPDVKRIYLSPEEVRARLATEIEHPLVIRNRETGRKSLYHTGAYCVRFKDMTEAESRPLLNFLDQHAKRPEFTVRMRWWSGSLALICNTHARHYAVQDYAGHRREMYRVEIAGSEPIGPANVHRFTMAPSSS
jgi:taurine dioxygenase